MYVGQLVNESMANDHSSKISSVSGSKPNALILPVFVSLIKSTNVSLMFDFRNE